ncbi:uridine kinase [Ezakiella coagulans]|uniref:uridine kinase n=1 Tax=Ezakiella coagulans TaxID=46507 RepID=UPI00288BEA8F|nr:uridine kinase [Ezakiella coagulans]
MIKPLIIGIAGGAGSGKSTISEKLKSINGENKVQIIDQNSFIKDFSSMSFDERKKLNLEHPDSFDFDYLIRILKDLALGNTVSIPAFDFVSLERTDNFQNFTPKDIIIVEGSLILYEKKLRDLFDIKVFIDTDSDIRLIRRIIRDTKEKSMPLEKIILEYISVVKPTNINFVEPTKRFADIIIPEGGENEVAINILNAKIKGTFKHL